MVTLLPSGMVDIELAAGDSKAIVSYQMVEGVKKVDVKLDGTDHLYDASKVAAVLFNAKNTSANEEFTNLTNLTSVAYASSGTNHFVGGAGTNIFYGGAGTNDFVGGAGVNILLGGSGINTFDVSAGSQGMIMMVGGHNTLKGDWSHYSLLKS